MSAKTSELKRGMVLTGLARTVFMEQRARYGTSLDLQLGKGPVSATELAWAAVASGEFSIAVRAGRYFALRMCIRTAPSPRPLNVPADRTCIVNGGTKVCKAHAYQF